jgi:hypothetical protein
MPIIKNQLGFSLISHWRIDQFSNGQTSGELTLALVSGRFEWQVNVPMWVGVTVPRHYA